MEFKILQINLRNSRAATCEMVKYSITNSIDLILIQDPYIKNNVFQGIPMNWTSFLSKEKTAAIILTKNSYFGIQSFQAANSIFVNIQLLKSSINFGSLYSSPSSDLEEDLFAWQEYFEDPNSVILGGDFNARLRNLGYHYTDSRGNSILNLITNTNFVLLNDAGGPRTYSFLGRTGNPDLTFCSPVLYPLLSFWGVDDETDTQRSSLY